MMEVETYTYEDTDESHSLYLMIESWFDGRFPEPELLPKLGVLVKEDDEYLCFVCADMRPLPRCMQPHSKTSSSPAPPLLAPRIHILLLYP